MPPLSYRAIAIAFASELVADFIIGMFVFRMFAGDLLSPDMDEGEFAAVVSKVMATTALVPWMMVFGTATTVGGAYLAARIAKRIPYYHGLAMGVVGILYIAITWDSALVWPNILGLLITIPASLFGAHLARLHRPEES
jgi:ABC-type enterochelin transport system permease subunit